MLITDLNKDRLNVIKDMPIDFPFPDISDPAYVGKKIVIGNNRVIGAGFVKVTTEGILIIDSEQNKITKSLATVELIEYFKKSISALGINECHVFVHDTKFQAFLRKLGFEDCKGGKPMVLHF